MLRLKRGHANYEMDMCTGPLVPKIIRYSLPLMLTGILQHLYNAADIIVVGRFVGDTALAAVSSTGSLINLIVNVFMGLSVGTSVIVARYYGAGDAANVSKTVHTSIGVSHYGGARATYMDGFPAGCAGSSHGICAHLFRRHDPQHAV